ncbi:MAG: substrate-binding domain-containing protein, partial [Thermoflexales bacterium]|nr:substrate-binding domain-containing protein [Thermoflexales bacterium]
MINNEGPSQVAHTRSQAMRLTIGYLTPAIHDASQPQWAGVVDAAKKHGVNLICVPGQSLHYPQEFSTPANILYELVNAQNVDGVISWASSIGNYVNDDELRTFHTRYHPLPVVTLGRRVDDNIPYLVMDSYVGMREAIVHLIQVHGYRRLVFIRGPENHLYAQERYRAYTDTLEAYGIPLDPELVSPYCYWESHFGAEAMRLLLDERGLRPQLDFEAIVSANDHLLLGVLETLQSRGIRVPGEVAVVGFDDITLARTSMPPFTSVAAPFYEMGHRAVEMLLAMIEGERVPMKTTVPAKLVVRQSCGCLDPAVVQAAAVAAVDGDRRDRSSRTVSQPDFKTILAARRKDILDKMVQAAGMPIEGQALAWAGQLLDALCGTLSGEATRTFLSTLDDILRQVRVANGDVSAWQNVLSALRHQALPYLEDKEALQIEDLWGQARVLTGEAAQRAQAHQTLQAIQQAQALREISLSLIVAFDIKELMDVLAQGLPRLGMPSCYLSLYENPQAYQYPQSIPAWSRLALAYNEQGCAELEGQAFPSRQLVPRELWSQKGSRSDRPRSFVVEPLYFQKDQIGLVLFEVGPREGTVYDALRGQISSALKGALLVQQVQERSAALVRQQYILDTFMANVPDSIYFKDRDSRITHANPAHARGLGLQDVADEIGKTDFDFFPEEQARIKYELEQEIIHTGQPILAMEEPCAQRRWVLTTKMPLRDEKGEIVGTFGISRDITELKRMQETLEKANVEISTLNERLKAENVRMEAELDVT